MKEKIPLIVVVGQTASGKSALGVFLARRFKGEVISADSRQVYRHLTVGTAKISKKEMHGIPHHLINIADPKSVYTAAEFVRDGTRVIQEIADKKRIPIVVGGTGFWIDALLAGFALPQVAPDKKLRKQMESKTATELMRILKKLDPRRADSIDPHNPRRIIRAIEIARALGCVPRLIKKESPYRVFWIGIHLPQTLLRGYIEKRARSMIARGLLKETKNLIRKKISKKRIREFGFEYNAALRVIENALSKNVLLQQLTLDTINYAKRQNTWFKRNSEIYWLNSPRVTRNPDLIKKLSHFLAVPRKRNKK